MILYDQAMILYDQAIILYDQAMILYDQAIIFIESSYTASFFITLSINFYKIKLCSV